MLSHTCVLLLSLDHAFHPYYPRPNSLSRAFMFFSPSFSSSSSPVCAPPSEFVRAVNEGTADAHAAAIRSAIAAATAQAQADEKAATAASASNTNTTRGPGTTSTSSAGGPSSSSGSMTSTSSSGSGMALSTGPGTPYRDGAPVVPTLASGPTSL